MHDFPRFADGPSGFCDVERSVCPSPPCKKGTKELTSSGNERDVLHTTSFDLFASTNSLSDPTITQVPDSSLCQLRYRTRNHLAEQDQYTTTRSSVPKFRNLRLDRILRGLDGDSPVLTRMGEALTGR